MVSYKTLELNKINRELFVHFIRHQVVDKCRRKVDGQWKIVSDKFVDDWSGEEYAFLVTCLQNTVEKGGLVCGAFVDGKLKGFVSVENTLFGREKEYLDLTSIHVSEDVRGLGIGQELFRTAKDWAAGHGAKKLYISAHSAIESQAFYRAMGCVEAKEYCQKHVEEEPCDCQLECEV